MKDKRLFLLWALFVALILIGVFIGARLGWVASVLKDDSTRLIAIPLVLFVVTTAWCGRLSWRLSSGDDPREIGYALPSPWFASSVCVSLGLLGTAVGYFLMIRQGGGTAQTLFEQIRSGMGIAFINTIVGGYCGLLLEVQCHFLQQAAKKAQRKRREDRAIERFKNRKRKQVTP